MKNYNRESAIEYAQKWALSANPNFYHFDKIGGDCTNFISQCLLSGGGIMNYSYFNGWFYNSLNNRSASWTSVFYLQKFLLSNSSPGFSTKTKDLSELEIGDLIQLRQNPKTIFNHSLIITNITDNDIFVCAHSDDALNRPLSSYNFEEALGIHIIGIN